MNKVSIRFYEELNDFLPECRYKQWLEYAFTWKDTVRNAVESFGIPHTEVDLILVNGESAGFEKELKDGDTVSVYPVFESIDISETTQLRPEGLRDPAFILDVHLGKLTGYLRMLGFDCLYRNNLEDNEIIRLASEEQRIILTRDKGILRNKKVTHGYFLRSDNPKEQVKEILRRFDLKEKIRPFTRCMNCNGILERITKEKIMDILEENTKKYYDEFYRCEACENIYWKGAHYREMVKWVEELERS
ncbi:MAG: Mut7-C ubiquitin/RNAse domain-containing protein [Bacteroidales bacterium]|nr:Mut7-C ubiquitin/RNAse domain-containing protein [Bacteroidales bacterium]MCF8334652.1 Mut7-C ubiquitin/RNAse domain-containing protein [Bacteroidales bacterium]